MKDILRIKDVEHKVSIQNNKILGFRAKDILRTGARVFTKNGLVASASQVGAVSEEALLEKCEQNMDVALPAEGLPSGSEKGKWSIPKGSAETAMETTETFLSLITRELPNFIVQGQTTVTDSNIEYLNSEGAELSSSCGKFAFFFDIRRRGSPNISDGFFWNEDLLGFHVEDLAWTIELFRRFDSEVKIQPGRHKVLMIPDDRALMKIGDSLKADSYFEDTALYSKRLGEKIFSDRLSISDLRNIPERIGFRPFDFEGQVAKDIKHCLVEKGVLKALVSDLKNEKRHGVKSTANGFRNYNSSVKLNYAALSIEPGHRPFRDILKDAGEVIVSFMAYGGDITAQGDFSTPIQLAFLTRNGEVVGRLPALSMSSHLEQMLGASLLEVASTGPTRHGLLPYVLCEMDFQLI